MKEKRFLLAIAALSLLATSCAEDIKIFGKNDKSFQFKVTTDNGPAVKSGSDVWAIAEDSELEVGDMKLTLSATASYNRMDPFASINTKGTVLNNNNLADKLQEFDLYIPMADIQNVKVAAEDGKWSIQPNAEGAVPVWPEEYHDKIDMPFIAYTGGDLDVKEYNKFTYTSPAKESDQIDLLYAYTEANKNDVAIHFYHALSAVRFIVDGLKDGRTVTSVKIKGVANSGKAEYKGNEDFAWTPGDTKAEFTAEDAATCTFFVIPQSVGGIFFEILIKDANDNEYLVEAKVPDLVGGWKAGYFYTYNINGGEGTVDIKVSETFDEKATKENVGAENTGKLASYVRAIVLANWYNEAGKVVAPYTGTITYNTTDWEEVNDIYYHKDPVVAGATSSDLISSFSVDNTTAPTNTGFALHLEMKVMVQAVEYDKANVNVQAAWPEASSVYPTPTATE